MAGDAGNSHLLKWLLELLKFLKRRRHIFCTLLSPSNMPKLKWNDCSALMNPATEVGRAAKRMNIQKKCISLGKSSSDRKWVDYSNSKIFIKKRPNHEYNILRQVLSRDKRLSESLKYEVKWTDYSQHFVHSPYSSPCSPFNSPSPPSSPINLACSLPNSPVSTPPQSEQRYSLSTSTPELSLSSSLAIASSISYSDSNYLHGGAPPAPSSTYQPNNDSFYIEIQPLALMEGELYYA